MNYADLSYQELKKLCAERGLKAVGNTEKLIEKLVNADLGNAPEPEPKPVSKKAKHKGLKPTDPNPDNPNWDMCGRWIRR